MSAQKVQRRRRKDMCSAEETCPGDNNKSSANDMEEQRGR